MTHRVLLAALLGVGLFTCCSQPDAVDSAYDFDADPGAAQRALLDPDVPFETRDSAAFRDAVSEALVAHAISELDLVRPDEPGQHITLELKTVARSGEPIAGAVVRIFSTDAQGIYNPRHDGEEMPRIFGRAVSDANGLVRFRLVRPGAYPGTRNARHVHVFASKGDLRWRAPGYLTFDDDPLLEEPQNEEPRSESVRIAMDASGIRPVGRASLTLE